MAEPLRGLQISRRSWLLAGLATPLLRAWAADSLTVSFDGDNLHLASPDLHFLNGKSLTRLHDGSSVMYVAKITLFRDQWVTQFKRAEAKFVVSYDVLGEDKFEVTMPEFPSRRQVNLSKAATEAWCLENIWIAAAGLSPDRPFWLQLDVSVEIQRDLSKVLGDKGLSVDLIGVFSSVPGSDAPVTRRAGPLRLADLVRKPGRGPNG